MVWLSGGIRISRHGLVARTSGPKRRRANHPLSARCWLQGLELDLGLFLYENTQIPFIGNGDIKDPKQIDDYLGTHCDALMIGRAAIGNPMIFDDFSRYHKRGEIVDLSNDEKKQRQKELFLKYLEKLSHYDVAKQHQRIWRQAMWFFKGIEGAKKLRVAVVEAKDDLNKVIKLVKEF